MKILIKSPGAIVLPPYSYVWGATGKRLWHKGKQAVLDAMPDVDLSKMAVNWLLDEVQEIGEVASGKIIVKGKPFEQYLKEQSQ